MDSKGDSACQAKLKAQQVTQSRCECDELPPEKLKEYQDMFDLFDKQGEGQITTKELGTVIRSLGFNPTEAELAEWRSEFDPLDTGFIPFTSFLRVMMQNVRQVDEEHELREAFRVFDKEGNGFITAHELRHIMMNLGERLTADECNEMLREADTLGTGNIDYEEFINLMIARQS